ncbi:MAG: TlpA family protein disulfide reductase [Vulcanimicrobiota bacterium]
MKACKSLVLVLVGWWLTGLASADNFVPLPDWSLTASNGARVSRGELDGKVVVLEFWASWCLICRQQVPTFVTLQKRYNDQGLRVVGFSFDQDQAVHADWVKSVGLNYPSIFARSGPALQVVRSLVERVGPVESIPTTLVVNRQGNIVFRHNGYLPPDELEKVVKGLLAQP